MTRYCTNCGEPLKEGMRFCGACGAPVDAADGPAPDVRGTRAAGAQPAVAGNGAVREGVPAPGFSDRVEHPEIRAAVKRNQRATGVFALLVVPLPLVGFVAYSSITGDMELGEALRIGACVSAVFLVFALVSMVRSHTEKPYEAVVIDKSSKRVRRHGNSDDDDWVTEYVTVVRTTSGKRKKIVEREGLQSWAYDYLDVGDRFRYHPQFNFPFERYDKASAPYLVCVSCGTHNPVVADRCSRCKLPLLK